MSFPPFSRFSFSHADWLTCMVALHELDRFSAATQPYVCFRSCFLLCDAPCERDRPSQDSARLFSSLSLGSRNATNGPANEGPFGFSHSFSLLQLALSRLVKRESEHLAMVNLVLNSQDVSSQLFVDDKIIPSQVRVESTRHGLR